MIGALTKSSVGIEDTFGKRSARFNISDYQRLSATPAREHAALSTGQGALVSVLLASETTEPRGA